MPITGTVAGDVVQLLVKRQAPTGCVLYRYGTFATNLDIIRKSRESWVKGTIKHPHQLGQRLLGIIRQGGWT